jgi:hypothetical protein
MAKRLRDGEGIRGGTIESIVSGRGTVSTFAADAWLPKGRLGRRIGGRRGSTVEDANGQAACSTAAGCTGRAVSAVSAVATRSYRRSKASTFETTTLAVLSACTVRTGSTVGSA